MKTPICEAQRLQPLTLDELIGTLMAYKIESNNESRKSIGKKFITYKANTLHVDSKGLPYKDNDDEDMALSIQELQKLFKKKKKCKRLGQHKKKRKF